MIDSSKLLPNRGTITLSKGSVKKIALIERKLILIDSLLKQKLLLSKVREGIRRQEEERIKRTQRELSLEKEDDGKDDLDSEGQRKRKPKDPKDGGGTSLVGSALIGAGGVALAKNAGLIIGAAKVATVLIGGTLAVGVGIAKAAKSIDNIKSQVAQFGPGGAAALKTAGLFTQVLSNFVGASIAVGIFNSLPANLTGLKLRKKFQRQFLDKFRLRGQTSSVLSGQSSPLLRGQSSQLPLSSSVFRGQSSTIFRSQSSDIPLSSPLLYGQSSSLFRGQSSSLLRGQSESIFRGQRSLIDPKPNNVIDFNKERLRRRGFSVDKPLGARTSLSKRGISANFTGFEFDLIKQARARGFESDFVMDFLRRQTTKQKRLPPASGTRQFTKEDFKLPSTDPRSPLYDPIRAQGFDDVGEGRPFDIPETESARVRLKSNRGNVPINMEQQLQFGKELEGLFGDKGQFPNPKLLNKARREVFDGVYKGLDNFTIQNFDNLTPSHRSFIRKVFPDIDKIVGKNFKSISKKIVTGDGSINLNKALPEAKNMGGGDPLGNVKRSQFFDPMNPRASVVGGGFADSFFDTKSTKTVNQIVKNADNIVNVKSLSDLLGAFGGIPLIKATRKFLGNTIGRIPVLGDLLGLLLDLFVFKEPLGRALFMAAGGALGGSIGAFLGGALGSAVPVVGNLAGAVVGGFLGGVGGDMLGGFLYDRIVGGKQDPQTSSQNVQKGLLRAPESVLKGDMLGRNMFGNLMRTQFSGGGNVPDIGSFASYNNPRGRVAVKTILLPLNSESDESNEAIVIPMGSSSRVSRYEKLYKGGLA